MSRGDGYQCDIPDPSIESLLRELKKKYGFARSQKRSETAYWEHFYGVSGNNLGRSSGGTITKWKQKGWEECDASEGKYRHGDNYGIGCINEPLCCKSSDQCNCEGRFRNCL